MLIYGMRIKKRQINKQITMHQKNIITAGKELDQKNKVLIMLHGRGGSAEDILSLSSYLEVKDFALMAPQATNNTWYPYSFLSPPRTK